MKQSRVMPELKPIESFFSAEKSFDQGSNIIILVVSSLSEWKLATRIIRYCCWVEIEIEKDHLYIKSSEAAMTFFS